MIFSLLIIAYAAMAELTMLFAIVIDYYDYYIDVDIEDYIMLSILLWPIFIVPYTIFVIRIITLAIKAKLPFKKHWAIGIWSRAFKKRRVIK